MQRDTQNAMLDISNLHAAVGGVPILKGVDLHVAAGEVHAVMGPNGSGKSTLAHVLAGRPGVVVTDGSVQFQGRSLLDMDVEERGCAGVFLGLQYPVEIPGVTVINFLRTALNARRAARGEPPVAAAAFLRDVRHWTQQLDMTDDMIRRPLNVGFSGGEKKRCEVLQMALFAPTLTVLDETDSGLDIDAMQIVARTVTALRAPDRATLLITHYKRLLDHVAPDRVHVLMDGRIQRSGRAALAGELERTGYGSATA